MLFTSVPAVFSSTSSGTSRPGGNSGCFGKGKKKQNKNKTAVAGNIFADGTQPLVTPRTLALEGAEAAEPLTLAWKEILVRSSRV